MSKEQRQKLTEETYSEGGQTSKNKVPIDFVEMKLSIPRLCVQEMNERKAEKKSRKKASFLNDRAVSEIFEVNHDRNSKFWLTILLTEGQEGDRKRRVK